MSTEGETGQAGLDPAPSKVHAPSELTSTSRNREMRTEASALDTST